MKIISTLTTAALSCALAAVLGASPATAVTSSAPTAPTVVALSGTTVPLFDLRGNAVFNNDLGGIVQGQGRRVDVIVDAATGTDPYLRGLSAVADGVDQPAATDRIRFWINGVRQPDITPELINGAVYFDAMDNRAPVDLGAGRYRLRFFAARLAQPVDRLSFSRVYPFGNGG